MSGEGPGHRPPSPPHSIDGDLRLTSKAVDSYLEPYTPPRSIRPTSSEPIFEHFEDHSIYPLPPPVPPVYYSSPQPTFVRHVEYRSSPTPSAHITTRSGRSLGSPMTSTVNRRSRPKKAKASKAYKRGTTALPGPLSEITKEYSAPVRDIEAWVNRSTEERLKEVQKNKGKIARPMNSFMLYRSAYAARVKQFCSENNHQVVSQVTGQSWPMEPASVREMYERFALIERDNHAAAHPNYKFAPNKNGKRRGDFDDGSNSDGEWGGSRNTKRSKTRRPDEDSRSLASAAFESDQTRYAVHYPPPQPHPSSYQMHNPHGPMPFQLGADGLRGGYYQPHTMPYHANIDDVKFSQIEPDFSAYDMGTGLIGMPDGSTDLLAPGPHHILHDLPPEQMVDPRLAGLDMNYSYGHFDMGPELYSVPRSYPYSPYPQQQIAPSTDVQVHPGMATLTDSPGGWSPSAGQPGSEFDRELQNF